MTVYQSVRFLRKSREEEVVEDVIEDVIEEEEGY